MLPAGRKSKIRPPRKSLVASGDQSVDYDASWATIADAIRQIQGKNVSSLSYEQLYRIAYMLVLRKHAGRLYNDVAQVIAEHLRLRRELLLAVHDGAEEFMHQVIAEWTDHLQAMKFISDVLMYLNRVYVKEHKKLLVYDLGIQLFKDNVIKYRNDELGTKIVNIMILEITRSRRGEAITSGLYISKLALMLELLVETTASELQYGDNYYQNVFEPALLTRSETFFRDLADENARVLGSEYLARTSRFVVEEENRITLYLPSATLAKLGDLMNNILIKDRIDAVMALPYDRHGMSYWLEPLMTALFGTSTESHAEELASLYVLMARVDLEFNLLRVRLREAIVGQGKQIYEWVNDTCVREKGERKGKREGDSEKGKSEKAKSEKDNDIEVKDKISTEKKANEKESGSPETLGKPDLKARAKSKPSSSAFALLYVDTIIKYEQLLWSLCETSFAQNSVLEQAMTTALREFINAPSNKRTPGVNAPEVLSVYIDHHIKQTSKSVLGTELTNSLVQTAIRFLHLVKDKDAFEANYANHFAKRFLNAKGSGVQDDGVDIEELLISKLGEEMGASSLDKVIKMNKDIKLSWDITTEWKQHSLSASFTDLDMKICNVADWPKSMTKDYQSFADESNGLIWPRQLRPTIKAFEEFWFSAKKNHSKSLYWSPKFGSMDLRITYPSRTYEINMPTYAGIIMLLFSPQSTDADGAEVLAFEHKAELTFVEIKELTRIPDSDLRRHLQSIAVAPRLRLLIKLPMSKEVNDTDVFVLNDKFKSPSAKVKVLTVSATSSTAKTRSKTEAEVEDEEINLAIQEGRKIETNAAIVRIMKSRRELKHNVLIEELVKQLLNRFLPPILLIKQRIEELIEKEYLKRDEKDRTIYHYVA